MQQILALVDFDNYASLNDVPGQKPKQHHVDRCLEQLISHIISWSNDTGLNSGEIAIRLYGGWYDTREVDSRTEARCMIDTFCYNLQKRRGKFRILMDAADSPLFSPSTTFTYTLQESNTSLNIKQKHLDQCSTKSTCKTKTVYDWQKSGCPGCPISHEQFLKKFAQKNVDTAIVADTIYSTIQRKYKHIILVSADYDMLPGILFAVQQKQPIVVFRNHPSVWFDYMLGDCDIHPEITPNYR